MILLLYLEKMAVLKTANSKINSMPGLKEKFHICFKSVKSSLNCSEWLTPIMYVLWQQ
jgi:hypothetical protein